MEKEGILRRLLDALKELSREDTNERGRWF